MRRVALLALKSGLLTAILTDGAYTPCKRPLWPIGRFGGGCAEIPTPTMPPSLRVDYCFAPGDTGDSYMAAFSGIQGRSLSRLFFGDDGVGRLTTLIPGAEGTPITLTYSFVPTE